MKADYLLKFPGKEELQYVLIDPAEAAVDPKKVHELKLDGECYQVSEELFEHDALIFDGGQIGEVWLYHKDGTPYVGMKCEGFPNFGIWSVKDAPFVTRDLVCGQYRVRPGYLREAGDQCGRSGRVF